MLHSALTYAWYYFWIAPHLLLFGIAALMLRRGLHRQFPWFFFYITSEALISVVAFVLSHIPSFSPENYAKFASVQMTINICARFGIIRELFVNLFARYPALLRTGRLLLRWSLVTLFLVAVGLAAHEPGALGQQLGSLLSILDRSASLVQCGLVAVLLVIFAYFKLSWQNFSMGIAFGLGVFASVELGLAAMYAHLSPVSHSTQIILDFVGMGTYHLCVLIWLGYLLAPERVRRNVAITGNDLKSWDDELQRLLQR